MQAQIAQALDDLKIARDLADDALFRNPEPQPTEHYEPGYFQRHLFGPDGKPLPGKAQEAKGAV